MSISIIAKCFESCLCNHIASSSKASSSLFHGESLLIWRFSMLECLNSIILAFDEFVLWFTISWSVLKSWVWLLIFNTLLVGFWCIGLVVIPVSVIVLIEVESVISFDIWEDDRFSFPEMVILCSILSQSIVAVKRSLEWVLFVVFLSSFSIINWWNLAQTVLSSHFHVHVLLVCFMLHVCVIGLSLFG